MLALLTQRRFAPLFWTQFLAAFNDNFLKNALIFLIMAQLSAPEAQTRITLAGGLFMLPFFLLSGLGGEMADRYDKARIAQRLKLSELAASALSSAKREGRNCFSVRRVGHGDSATDQPAPAAAEAAAVTPATPGST